MVAHYSIESDQPKLKIHEQYCKMASFKLVKNRWLILQIVTFVSSYSVVEGMLSIVSKAFLQHIYDLKLLQKNLT